MVGGNSAADMWKTNIFYHISKHRHELQMSQRAKIVYWTVWRNKKPQESRQGIIIIIIIMIFIMIIIIMIIMIIIIIIIMIILMIIIIIIIIVIIIN